MSEPPAITQLLRAHADGDQRAFDQLFSAVYAELRRLAHGQRRWAGARDTVNTTGLVHEAYLKLMEGQGAALRDRQHFFALAARIMRQVLVDYAKSQRREKRGGNRQRVDTDLDQLAVQEQADLILAVDQALERLSLVDQRLTQVVECRYFAGLSEKETADTVGVSVATVQRCWQAAKTWLGRELAHS